MATAAIAGMLGWIVGDGRIRRRIFGRMFVRLLRVFLTRITVIPVASVRVSIASVCSRLNAKLSCPRIAVIQLDASLVAQLVERKCLLIFQIAAKVSIFAACPAALGQFALLALMQAVDLVVKIGF